MDSSKASFTPLTLPWRRPAPVFLTRNLGVHSGVHASFTASISNTPSNCRRELLPCMPSLTRSMYSQFWFNWEFDTDQKRWTHRSPTELNSSIELRAGGDTTLSNAAATTHECTVVDSPGRNSSLYVAGVVETPDTLASPSLTDPSHATK